MKNHLVLLTIVLGFTGCSTAPVYQTPVENRTLPTPEPQVKSQDQTVVTAIPDQIMIPAQTIEQNTAITKPDTKTIVPVSPSVIQPVQQNTAVIALLNSAKSNTQQGALRSAQITLQRAQRIAPNDPEVYYVLAQTHLELEDYALAEQVALKGVSLAQGQASQLRRFWTLIAEIRTAAGNTQGAKKARDTASKY